MNYIKDVELKADNFLYNMIIEIRKGSKDKNELVEPNFEELKCVRKSLLRYPFYYGCFPQTLAGDGDALDAILITKKKHKELDIVKVLPITVIKTLDNGEEDHKIICIEDSKIKHLDKLVTLIRKFLSVYKGKKADMIIDGKDYAVAEPLRLIEETHKKYGSKASVNSLKVE